MSDSGWRGRPVTRPGPREGHRARRPGRRSWSGQGGSRATSARFQRFARADGADSSGLARFVELHGVTIAGDAALTVSLAGTVFAMPVDEARGQVALFLLLTMAPSSSLRRSSGRSSTASATGVAGPSGRRWRCAPSSPGCSPERSSTTVPGSSRPLSGASSPPGRMPWREPPRSLASCRPRCRWSGRIHGSTSSG